MERIFVIRLIILMAASTLLLLILSNYFIKANALQSFRITSEVKINQVVQILFNNEKEIKTLRAATHESYLNKVRAVAYIIKENPAIVNDPQELTNIAALIQIDEINIFDENGIIISGTVPEYVGVGVEDGEQIRYFKQILDDPTLELVQDILPSSADGKMMQYSGSGRKDKKGIVQVGMRPERMLETLRRSEVSHVLSDMVIDINESICLLNNETGLIKGISSSDDDKPYFHDAAFTKNIFENSKLNKFVELSGSEYFAVTLKTKDGIIYVAKNRDSIMNSVIDNTTLLAISLTLIAILMIVGIVKLLEIHVIRGIEGIIKALRKITDGNLDTIVSIDNNPELKELSRQINIMVGYLLHSTSKISKIIDSLDINIAIYEYRTDIQSVIATNRLGSILGLKTKEEQEILKDKSIFEKKIFTICQNFQDREDKMIYRIPSLKYNKYIKIKTFNDFNTTMGIVIDVTDDILRRDIMIYERDYDILSELYNRRAFVRETDRLFSDTKQLKVACIMMIDMDNLKTTNDIHGHHNGDKYIKAGADILRKSQLNENVIISRLGGDEFSIMWYGYDTQEQIIKNIENMYKLMLETIILVNETQTHPVRFSGGYAFYPEHSQDKSMLLKLSDKALYNAKQNHKCKFIRYKPNI